MIPEKGIYGSNGTKYKHEESKRQLEYKKIYVYIYIYLYSSIKNSSQRPEQSQLT